MTAQHSLAVTFAGFSAFLPFYATQPLLPTLVREFRTTQTGAGLTITAATAGVAIAAPLSGWLADRVGRKRVIVAAAVLVALVTALSATASGLATLVFWRFLQGLFTPGLFAVTVAYIQEEWAAEGAGRATSAYVTGTIIGGFSGRLFSGLIAAHLGWQAPFAVLAVLGFAAAFALWRWLPRERNFSHANRQPGAVLDHLRNRRLIATFAAGFCVLFSLLGTFTYVTFYLAAEPFHFGPAALGSLFFVYLIGAIVTPWSGRAIDRHGQRVAVAVAMALSSTGLLLTLYPRTLFVVAGLALCCTGVFAAQAASSTHIGRATSHSKALAVGMYVMFYYAGGSAGAALPGLFWNRGGWPACVALFIAVQAVTVAIALRWWLPGHAKDTPRARR